MFNNFSLFLKTNLIIMTRFQIFFPRKKTNNRGDKEEEDETLTKKRLVRMIAITESVGQIGSLGK